MWKALTEIFGTSFLTIHGETPSRYWTGEIANLTDDQCRQGLARVVKMNREYPVNLTEFVEACSPTAGSPTFLGTPINPESLRLPHKPSDPQKVRHHIANMRALVADAKPQPKREEPEEIRLLDGVALINEKTRQLKAIREWMEANEQSEDVSRETSATS